VVAYVRWSFTRIEPWKLIELHQCLSYAVCSSMLSLENVQVVAYKRLKAMEIHQPSGPKSGRGRLQEVVVY